MSGHLLEHYELLFGVITALVLANLKILRSTLEVLYVPYCNCLNLVWSLQKSKTSMSAGPWLLGFFAFVLVGSGE